MQKKILAILVSFLLFAFTHSPAGAEQNLLQIYLLYPQKSNAPKREPRRVEKPAVVRGKVCLDVAGINQQQLNKPQAYVEYFLDEALIYSSQKEESRQFILDTCLYADGRHTIVANLWDKDGPSAIGIREILIQNQDKNETPK